jgi:hypothetical protein
VSKCISHNVSVTKDRGSMAKVSTQERTSARVLDLRNVFSVSALGAYRYGCNGGAYRDLKTWRSLGKCLGCVLGKLL